MRACITVCVAVVALAASACGNGTPSTPTRTPTELSPLLAGTVTALAAPTRTPVPMASPDTSEARSESVLSVEWRPDGMALAAEVIDLRSGSNRRFLGLVDVQTGSIEPLVEIPALGTLAPVAWNTSGDRLLFQFRGGRGCDSPELPRHTTLEVLPRADPAHEEGHATACPRITNYELLTTNR